MSGIPPGVGTNRNEALHRHLKPYFNKARLGVQAGYALLCLLFWLHNKKASSSSEMQPLLPNSSQLSVSHDHAYIKKETFGIVAKIPGSSSFWGTSPLMPFEDSVDMIADIEDDISENDSEGCISTQDAKFILQDVLNTTKMIETSEKLFTRSPLLRKEFLPFVECHTKLCGSIEATARQAEHEQRLDDIIHVCGLTRLPVPKDGNCCFTAVSLALKIVYDNGNVDLQSDLKNIPLDIEESVEMMSDHLRELVYKEWLEYQEYYQEFVPEGDFEEEASKFLTSGFFMSSLGDTLVSALCNCIGIPIIVLSSILGTPILQFKPRSFLVHAPLVIAYNQFGAGHYDSVSYFKTNLQTSNVSSRLMCKCGVNDKSRIDRCCPNAQYGNRCPCLKQSVACSLKCLCKQCRNPGGKKPTMLSRKMIRKRQQNKLHLTHFNNTEFLKTKSEKFSKGEWSLDSLLESVLLRKTVNFVL